MTPTFCAYLLESQMEQMKAELELQRMQAKQQLDAEMLRLKHQFDLELKQAEAEIFKGREQYKEDRKDKRTDKQASQQSRLIRQRKENTPPVDFEGEGEKPNVLANFRAMMGQENA